MKIRGGLVGGLVGKLVIDEEKIWGKVVVGGSGDSGNVDV